MSRKKLRALAVLAAVFGRVFAVVGAAELTPLRRPAAPEEAAPAGGGDAELAAFRRTLLDPMRADRWLVPTIQGDVLVVVEKGYLDEAALDRFCAELQEGVAAVPSVTGRASHVRGRFTVYVYDRGPISQTGVRGVAAGERGLLLRFVKERRDPLFHELTHLLAGSSRSQSLSEGIAEVVQARLRPGRANAFIRAGADPDRNAAAALANYGEEFRAGIGAPGNPMPLTAEPMRYDFYYCSWSFAQFLLARGSMADFWALADAGGNDAAYQRLYGRPRAELVREWAEEVMRPRRDSPPPAAAGR
jgi:hypothetical protein